MTGIKIDQPSSERYPRETVGQSMIRKVPIVSMDLMVEEVQKELFKKAADFESVNYIYITDQEEKLIGVVSIKELIRHDRDVPIGEMLSGQKLIKVWAQADQEEAVKLAVRHSLKAIPVVNGSGYFQGVVSSDDILRILHEEHVEDWIHSVGIRRSSPGTPDPIGDHSVIEYFLNRLPWLSVGLLGGLLAAIIIAGYEQAVLAQMMVLAAFLPAVVYMADAVANQTQVVFVRYLAMDCNSGRLGQLWKKDIFASVLLAITFGLIMTLIGWVWQTPAVGIILGLTFLVAIVAAAGIGFFMPWAFDRLGFDPAIAAGPLSTAVVDVLSIAIYLSIAGLIISYLI